MKAFRARVIEAALAYWTECLVEGKDDARIGEILGVPNYPRNAWCGLFAQACWRAAGLERDLKSVGRAYYGFACGNRTVRGGKTKAFATYADPGAAYAADRFVVAGARAALPGDLVLHQDPAKRYNGHVMLCLSRAGDVIVTIEGNATGLLPNGKRAQGVVVRRWSVDCPYFCFTVTPAPQEVQE